MGLSLLVTGTRYYKLYYLYWLLVPGTPITGSNRSQLLHNKFNLHKHEFNKMVKMCRYGMSHIRAYIMKLLKTYHITRFINY